MLVSIIMPVYNKENRLSKSIDSVLNQTFTDYELIIINDGSYDHSYNILQIYSKKDYRIKIINQKNQGVSTTRNNGIDLARGELITFLDADDEWHKDFLSEMVKNIQEGNVCYCGHYYLEKGKKIDSRMVYKKGDILEYYIKNICTPNTNSWLIRRNFVNKYKIRFTQGISWGEDMMFFLKLLVHDINVKCVTKQLTYYNIGDVNSLSKNSLSKIQDDIFWMENTIEYLKDNIKEKRRLKKAVEAFETYRMPAAVIYRIYRNQSEHSKLKLLTELNKYNNYTQKMKLRNGLRSIKLYLLFLLIKLKLNTTFKRGNL